MNNARTGTPRIGCAGWSIPRMHAGLFGPGESMLARYATRFSAVEINSSFYRPHQRKTYERWASSVPATFRFSVKLPRAITHDQRLQGVGSALDRFLDEADGLGRKLEALLVQLPPSLALDARTASTFLAMLRRRWTGRVAFEPRHASWFGPEAERLWTRYAIGRVAADPPPCDGADHIAGDQGWRYWRWHGSPRMYYSAYDAGALAALARVVRRSGSARSAWVVFDNTARGHAIANAAALQSLLEPVWNEPDRAGPA